MKKLYFIILISFFTTKVISQNPTWDWAKSYAGNGFGGESIQSIVNDNLGSLISGGTYFSTQITFDTIILPHPGFNASIFILKNDTNGNVIWAKPFGGNDDDWLTSISTDAQGYIYAAGWFESDSISFGTTTLINNVLGVGNNADMFLVKLSPNGDVIWAKSWGGNNYDELDQIVYDNQGYIYATGIFKSASFSIGSTILTNDTTDNSSDFFVAKFDTTGNPIWVNYYGGSKIETSKAIALDPNGNIFVSGNFNSTDITIGTNTFNQIGGGNNAFIIKYNSSGSIIWVKQKSAIGNGNLNVETIAIDNSGHFYLGGGFGVTGVIFGSQTLTSFGAGDAYIAAFDNDGNDLWAKNVGSTSLDIGKNIIIDTYGNIIFSGWFLGSTLFVDIESFSNNGSGYDCYVIKYTSNGNRIWSTTYGGDNWDYSYSIASGGKSVYVAGKYLSSSISFGTTTVNNIGGADIFLAKLEGDISTAIIENQIKLNVSIYPNPTSYQLSIVSNMIDINELNIIDITGKTLRTITTDFNYINVAELSNGIYYIQLITGEGTIAKKFVKQ